MTVNREFSLGWKVLLASMIGVMCGAAPLPYNTIGFFMGPLNAEFNWSFGEMGLGVTIFGITASLMAPVIGWLTDRYGVRPVALYSLIAFGLSFAAFAFTPASLIGFYGLWLVMGLVSIGSTPVSWTRAINLWFFKNRGLALGLTLIGTSLAAVFLPKLTVALIDSYGWRMAYPGLALLPLGLALPLAFFLFREPRDDEKPKEIISTQAGRLNGVALAHAMKDMRFWIIFASIFAVALAYGGAHIHLPQILGQLGFERGDAAIIMGSLGIAIFAGRLITGFLFDHFHAPLVALPVLSLPAVACWMLASGEVSSTQAFISVMLFGLAAGAEMDVIAYLAGRYFGMAHYGKIYGMLYMPFGIAASISPALYGWVRDTYGSYDLMLQAAMILFLFGAFILLALGRYPDFSKETVTAS